MIPAACRAAFAVGSFYAGAAFGCVMTALFLWWIRWALNVADDACNEQPPDPDALPLSE